MFKNPRIIALHVLPRSRSEVAVLVLQNVEQVAAHLSNPQGASYPRPNYWAHQDLADDEPHADEVHYHIDWAHQAAVHPVFHEDDSRGLEDSLHVLSTESSPTRRCFV